MSVYLRILAWLLATAVTFATLGPADLRPHAGLGQDGEHALAFILTGLAFGLAYPRRRWITCALAIVLIGALELMQFWAPGRHARLDDFVVDAVTAAAGFVLAAAMEWAMSRLRANRSVTNEGPAE